MKTFDTLMNLVTPSAPDTEIEGRATRIRLAILAMAAAAIGGAIFGVGVGSTELSLATANILKIPLVLLIPMAFSWPIGALVSKFMGTPIKGSELALSQSIGIFGTGLILAVLAPIVALFYHTTATLGGVVAMVAIGFASIVGLLMFFRAAHQRRSTKIGYLPAAVVTFFYCVSSIQVIALVSPILVESTRFSGGIPGLF